MKKNKILLFILFVIFHLDVFSHTQNIIIEKRNGEYCYDGDTCNAKMLGVPDTLKKIKIRINGIDTPEIKGKCEREKKLALEAKVFINDLIKNSTVIYLKNMKWGKYGGRVVADLYIDKRDYREYLKGKNFYVEYYGGKKTEDWCED
ncbi:MAG: thermonuclease family protein [Thermodesulfobacteriota bacterium]|nr:thermonuclease family protein [Thermodesulfobacteriota bacterium]